MGWYSNTVAAGSTVRVTVDKGAQQDFDAAADYLREDGSQHTWTHSQLVDGESAVTLSYAGDELNGVIYLYWARPAMTTVTIEVVSDSGEIIDSWSERFSGDNSGAYSMLPIWVDAL
jgi:hypothetical protein